MLYSCGKSNLIHRPRSTMSNGVHSVAPPRHVATHEEIAALAYSYWEARGYRGGSALDDWLRAERELSRPASGPSGK